MRRRLLIELTSAILLTCLWVAPVPALAQKDPGDRPAASQAIPFKRQGPQVPDSEPRVVVVLLLALAGGIGGLVVLRRNLQKKGMIPSGNGSRITVVEMKRLSSKLNIFMLAVDGKEYLLLQSGEQTRIVRHDNKVGDGIPT
jgi:hypothetical protein